MKFIILNKIKKEYSNYLENGTYKYNNSFTQISNINYNKKINSYNDKTYSISKKIKNFFNTFFVKKQFEINSDKKEFKGKHILIPSTMYGVKIFSSDKILNYYHNPNYMNTVLANRKKMKEICNTTKLYTISSNYYIEEKIDNNQKNHVLIAKNILDIYIEYYKNKKNNCCIYSQNIPNIDKAITNFFASNNITSSFEKYPIVLQHNDLWSENILLSKGRLFFIDFEKVGNNYFLYDFFLYCYSELYINNNIKPLNNYFSGYYDIELSKYFAVFQLEYDKCLKKQYFYNFIILFCDDRFKNYHHHKKNKELRNTIKLLKRVLRKEVSK